MEQKVWHNPQADRQTTLAIADGGIFLGNPSQSQLAQAREAVEQGRSPAAQMGAGAIFVATDNLFRIVAESGLDALSLAYRHEGVRLGTFTFAQPRERDQAIEMLERELGLRRSTQKGSGGWAARRGSAGKRGTACRDRR